MRFKLRANFNLGKALGEPSSLDWLDKTLEQHAPDWHRAMYISDFNTPHPIGSGKLGDLVLQQSLKRGPIFEYYTSRNLGHDSRIFGRAFIKSRIPGMELYLNHDDAVLLRMLSGEVMFKNYFVLAVSQKKIFGYPKHGWIREFFAATCANPDMWYAHAEMDEHYTALNMDLSHGMRAVGLDAGKALPGLYWLNYFGPPYSEMIGRDRLLSAPATIARACGLGVLLQISDGPEGWDSDGYRAQESAVLDWIGREFFFNKARGYAGCRAPDFSGSIRDP